MLNDIPTTPSKAELRQHTEAALAERPLAATPIKDAEAHRLLHELQVHQIELEMQSESLRNSYADLEVSRDSYYDLYNNAPVAYLTLSSDLTVAEINRMGSDLLAGERTRLLGVSFVNLVEVGQRDAWSTHAQAAFRNGGHSEAEFQIRRLDGTFLDVRVDFLVLDAKQAGQELRIALTDISEQVATRRELELYRLHLENLVAVRNKSLVDAAQKYQRLFDGMMDAYVLMDMDGRVLDSNPAFRAMLGFSERELHGLNRTDLTPPAWLAGDARVARQQLMSADIPVSYEKQLVHKSGALIPVEVKAFLVCASDGRPEATWALVRELTARERAADEARLHQAILKNMGDGLHLVRTIDSVIVYANPAFERMFGYAPAELLNRHVSCLNAAGALTPEEIADNINAALYRDGRWCGELQNVRKDGTPIWCLVNISTLEHHAFGTVWVCVHTDISQRISLERALREEKRKFKLAVGGARLMVWDWNLVTDEMSMSDQWHALLDYQSGDIAMNGASVRSLIHPDDAERVRTSVSRHLSGEMQGFEIEYRMQHKRGHWVWILDRGGVIERDLRGGPVHLAGTLVDITHHKQLQTDSDDLLRRVESLVRGMGQGAVGAAPSDGVKAEKKPQVRLSPRQREIVRRVSSGLTSAQIAEQLNISAATVMAHRRDIMRKLDLHTVAALTRYALENDVGSD